MGVEWVLLSLMTVVAVWLGMDACRESKRLDARLSRVASRRTAPAEPNGTGERAHRPLATSADRVGVGPARH